MKDLPGPGQYEGSIFLPMYARCITRLCDDERADARVCKEEGAPVFLLDRKTSQGTPWGVCAHGGCSLVPCGG